MKNTYIVKKGNDILSFYYGENKSIYMQKIKGNQVIRNKVVENVLEGFSVSLDNKGQIYIFCQDEQDNVVLATSLDEGFKVSSLFKKDSNMSNRTIFNPLFFNRNISLIFNSLIDNSKDNHISIKTLLDGKQWTKSENIDIFSMANNNLFEVQKLNDKDIIIVYEKRDKDIQLGFKEIIDGKISPFIVFHRTGYQVVDFSFLSFNETTHFIYIVKNLFSSQVIYRRKDKNGISAPIILYEGQKIRNCSIAFIEGALYCMYIVNSNLFYSISNDLGESFLGVSKYNKVFSQDVIKANFITNHNNQNIYLNQIYVDYKNPLNIQFLHEICPKYISLNNDIQNSKEQLFYVQNEKHSNSGFISDLSNQNIDYNPSNNIEKVNLNQSEDNSFKTNEASNNKITISPTINRSYKTVTTESDFLSHFDPSVFEDILKNKALQANNIENQNYNKQQILNTENSTYKINDQIPEQNNINISESQNIEFIKNKLKIANEELEEKNNQLIKLNSIMQEKNKERLDIELELRRKIKSLQEENKKLKEDSIKKDTTIEGEIKEDNEKNVETNLGKNKKDRKE